MIRYLSILFPSDILLSFLSFSFAFSRTLRPRFARFSYSHLIIAVWMSSRSVFSDIKLASFRKNTLDRNDLYIILRTRRQSAIRIRICASWCSKVPNMSALSLKTSLIIRRAGPETRYRTRFLFRSNALLSKKHETSCSIVYHSRSAGHREN
ncbi:hypothetical protein EV127DRAFT_160384 [Xylaria flabelliformis]|nr:hypothetical protein EV127DRAFT_160384 [Xylaria flabelliformis]